MLSNEILRSMFKRKQNIFERLNPWNPISDFISVRFVFQFYALQIAEKMLKKYLAKIQDLARQT